MEGKGVSQAMPTSDFLSVRPRRVCLIKPSSLGDVVHALPVLSALRDLWPDAHLAWVVNRGLRGLLDGHPHLDEVIPFDRGSVGIGPRGMLAFARFASSLRSRRFDLAIDLQGLLRSGLMTAATGASVRVGLGDSREGAHWFYTHRIEIPPDAVHAVEKLMRIAGALGASTTPRFYPSVSEDDRAWGAEECRAVARPRLVLNVGARWLTKRWPLSSFAAFAAQAARDRGAGLVIVGAPEDRSLVDELIGCLGAIPVLDLSGKTTLPRLAAVMEAADCVLSNDTGPLHLAAATGVRVVGVYTCTKIEKTGPWGPNATAVASRVWCAGSCVKRCDRMECMTELTPDRVWEAVRRQLDAAVLGRTICTRDVCG